MLLLFLQRYDAVEHSSLTASKASSAKRANDDDVIEATFILQHRVKCGIYCLQILLLHAVY